MRRRDFLKAAGSASLLLAGGALACREDVAPPPDDGWRRGPLRHLLPTAGHRRLRIKASFETPFDTPPRLVVDGRAVPGEQSDADGRFFRFDARGLAPATRYELRLRSAAGDALCDPWPLATLPAPDAAPERLRLLVYTCAGGPDLVSHRPFPGFLPFAARQRLLARALALAPDAVVANGDHVYWDMESRFGWALGRSPEAWLRAGFFDREKPVLGTPNETVLKRAFGPQIAGLYGVRFRSVPMFFLQDDHDYGENDEASEQHKTFPPDPFMLDLAKATQHLYYPELLADETLPRSLLSPGGLAESAGRLRYGRLFEALLYDCRRHLALGGSAQAGGARFLPPDLEAWLIERTARADCAHLAHMPSTPVLWTAGKWGEWYPDVRDEEGVLGTQAPKPFWPRGWLEQHDRLLAAASERGDRAALFVSGDLHASGAGRILASGGMSLAANPVVSVLAGTIGTGPAGFPSRVRGTRPLPSKVLEVEEWLEPIEENGFSLLDVTPGAVRVSMFRWLPSDGQEVIDALEPFRVVEIPRLGAGGQAGLRATTTFARKAGSSASTSKPHVSSAAGRSSLR